MSSAFAFIPRSVAKGASHKLLKDTDPSKHSAHVPQESRPGPSTIHQKFTPQTEKNVERREDELLILIEAALSDYACWCKPELQREMKSGQDGYMSLKHVLLQSPIFETLQPRPSETDIMQCIRASPNSLLETRMSIAEPLRNEWFNCGPGLSTSYLSKDGGFEVRRKDWKALLRAISESGWNKEWWDQRTVYIERLPIAYYSIDALGRYIKSLLSLEHEILPTTSRTPQIQNITFPPHHLAARDKPSRCRGFAFIVLESPALVNILHRSYPWDSSSSISSVDKQSVKFGLRVLPKQSWENLKIEYLAYQQHLLSQVAEEVSPPQVEVGTQNISSELDYSNTLRMVSPPMETPIQPRWFPQNCLVFVRNIHPDTNKTTLRTLFSDPFTSSKRVDYVDFSKGIDTCHLRLGSPSDATQLVSHFTTQLTAQLDPLDQVGSAPTRERSRLELEIVRGKREELYWEKVPEKVRAAAMARMHSAENHQVEEENEGDWRRKRQKRA